jgi:Rrf2 family protein
VLSKKSKYAIIALIHLAKRSEEGPILIKDIAGQERIPQKFLEAILLDLKNSGILGSKKGKGGGYYLLKNPAEVNLAQIMRLFDGPIALIPCVTYVYYQKCEECKDEETCAIRAVFKEVRDATVAILKRSTLAELIRIEKNLIDKKK